MPEDRHECRVAASCGKNLFETLGAAVANVYRSVREWKPDSVKRLAIAALIVKSPVSPRCAEEAALSSVDARTMPANRPIGRARSEPAGTMRIASWASSRSGSDRARRGNRIARANPGIGPARSAVVLLVAPRTRTQSATEKLETQDSQTKYTGTPTDKERDGVDAAERGGCRARDEQVDHYNSRREQRVQDQETVCRP